MASANVYCDVYGINTPIAPEVKNKDAILIANLENGQTLANSLNLRQPLDKNSLLLIVAQGIGPDQTANAASELTTLGIKDALLRMPTNIAAYDRLVAAVEEANNIVWQERQNNPAMKDSMSTLTAVLIERDQAFIAEVGNSRAYLIRGEQIKQVTTDQIAESPISADNLINNTQRNSYRNLVLQAIGKAATVKAAICMFQLRYGDILLLSANNLSKILQVDEILGLTLALSPNKICQQITSVASKRASAETITTIAAQFTGEALSTKPSDGTITGSVHVLSRFDPEEKLEKNQKRTLLLGDTSLTKKYYKTDDKEDLSSLIPINSISSFPESNVLLSECETFLQHLNYCETLLSIKPAQLNFAANWLKQQGYNYTSLKTRTNEIAEGVKKIQQVKEVMQKLMKDLEITDDFSKS